jgi:hypothetical protein
MLKYYLDELRFQRVKLLFAHLCSHVISVVKDERIYNTSELMSSTGCLKLWALLQNSFLSRACL